MIFGPGRARPIAALVLLSGATLAACGGRVFDGTPYAGDLQPTVPRVDVAEVTPLGPAEAPPVPSVGGPIGVAPGLEPGGPAAAIAAAPAPAEPTSEEIAAREVQARRRAEAEAARQQAEARTTAETRQAQRAPAPAIQPIGPVVPLSFGSRAAATGQTGGETPSEVLPRPAVPDTDPNLADVPAPPTDLPTPEQRAVVQQQLEADRAAATGGLSFGGRAATAPAIPDVGTGDSARQVATLPFESGSAALPTTASGTLRQIASSPAAGTIRIVGYGAGDGAGRAAARAQAVASALIGLGVAPSRIVTDAEADTRDGVTDVQAARVEIFLVN
jgi:outer membrane protein OmpA-like peptidoglycan-associated protein